MLNENDTFGHLTAKDIMTKNPKRIQSTTMVADALNMLEDFAITQLIVVDNDEYKGVLHLHDILKKELYNGKKTLKEMSFLDHLEELRWLLVRSSAAVIIMAFAAIL